MRDGRSRQAFDGGHTFKLIVMNRDNEDLPDDQYVNVEVRVGIPEGTPEGISSNPDIGS